MIIQKTRNIAKNIVEFSEPRPHVIVTDLLTRRELSLVWKEIETNLPQFAPGTYQIKWVDKVRPNIKRSMTYSVNDVYKHIEDSVIRLLLYNRLCLDDRAIRTFLRANCPVFQLLRLIRDDVTRVSSYGNGDFYRWHTDQAPNGILTVLLMLCRQPKRFTGGDFEIKWKGKQKTIPFVNNTAVIFARNTPHRVTEVMCESEEFLDRRFSIQFFIDI